MCAYLVVTLLYYPVADLRFDKGVRMRERLKINLPGIPGSTTHFLIEATKGVVEVLLEMQICKCRVATSLYLEGGGEGVSGETPPDLPLLPHMCLRSRGYM